MAELKILEGDFILNKDPIIDAFIGGKDVVEIYLGKNLVWAKEYIVELALFDEIGRQFITEDGTNYIFTDNSLNL